MAPNNNLAITIAILTIAITPIAIIIIQTSSAILKLNTHVPREMYREYGKKPSIEYFISVRSRSLISL